jgi:hypothetical protein
MTARCTIVVAAIAMAAVPAMAQPSWMELHTSPNSSLWQGRDAQGQTWSGTTQRLGRQRFDTIFGPDGVTTCITTTYRDSVITNCN